MAKKGRSRTRSADKGPPRPKRAAAPKPGAAPKAPRPKRAAAKTATSRGRGLASTPVTKIKADYAKAVKLYEKALKALQRKQFKRAAAAFRMVMNQFPEERELHERASLYLNVCTRESGAKRKLPRTLPERILAATVALNRRDPVEAVSLLQKAASSHPSDDRLHYMLALAHAISQDVTTAANHLAKAIALNSDNRIQAREESDFDGIRQTRAFIDALNTP